MKITLRIPFQNLTVYYLGISNLKVKFAKGKDNADLEKQRKRKPIRATTCQIGFILAQIIGFTSP